MLIFITMLSIIFGDFLSTLPRPCRLPSSPLSILSPPLLSPPSSHTPFFLTPPHMAPSHLTFVHNYTNTMVGQHHHKSITL